MSEAERMAEDAARTKNWTRWGPYLSERQWGTVREDYSADGDCWRYFPHDHARSRAYRWGEDGLLGICDRECRLCFAVALWNGKDPILKERLFGLTGPEGNHGEDVKECYYYLDATPTASYLRAQYKYPQRAYPYEQLVEENQRRTRNDPEYELLDTGVFQDERYFDVIAEYAKAAPEDLCIRLTLANRGPDAATIHVLPTLWFRNTWEYGRTGDDYPPKPRLALTTNNTVRAEHATLGQYNWFVEGSPEWLFTENETNLTRLFKLPNASPYVKDAFHEYLINKQSQAVNPKHEGTKAAAHYTFTIPAGKSIVVRMRLTATEPDLLGGRETGGSETRPYNNDESFFDRVFVDRQHEADAYYEPFIPAAATPQERAVIRQGYAGLQWSKQFYNYVVEEWLEGDPTSPPPPTSRLTGRNSDWPYFHARDVLSMPDTWEYPWFAAWDLAFHVVALGATDPNFAKQQMLLLLREWYMRPNGQIPAYEFAFDDVNPPVHAWACWRLYKVTGARGARDTMFLERAFHKLLINFTWWVNRKDLGGKNLFAGGFLGLDNVGVFDRSQALPTGGHLEQADGTAWMAFYCTTMLSMALELARTNRAYEDVASKFFEHFVAITDAINTLGGSGLWDKTDGFYYDQLHANGNVQPLRIRSAVGIIPVFAAELLSDPLIDSLPGFAKRMRWFLEHRPAMNDMVAQSEGGYRLLALPTREQLTQILRRVLDEEEFFSPFGIRSLSRIHEEHPFTLKINGSTYSVRYEPGESTSYLFGGNSNWRGPIWFPLNYLLVEALERYHAFYGESFRVECPTGSGRMMTLGEVANEIGRRLSSIFLPDAHDVRPVHGAEPRYAQDPHWRDLTLFYEYFDGDTGRGLGASHQTGWTALVVRIMHDLAAARMSPEVTSPHYVPVRPTRVSDAVHL